jgi:hypothetical protein
MIEFNEPISSDNYRELAERHVRETLALLDASDWSPARSRGGVAVSMRDLDVVRTGGDGAPVASRSPTILARIRVDAPRDEVFELLAHPSRAPEWDASDRGFEWVAQYDDDHTVFRNFNQPPLFNVRDSVIYRVERAALEPDRSLYCARSVTHPDCPDSELPRILQQLFAWAVRDLDDGACEVTVLSSTPDNMIPPWLFKLAVVPGWRAILTKVRRLCAGV